MPTPVFRRAKVRSAVRNLVSRSDAKNPAGEERVREVSDAAVAVKNPADEEHIRTPRVREASDAAVAAAAAAAAADNDDNASESESSDDVAKLFADDDEDDGDKQMEGLAEYNKQM